MYCICILCNLYVICDHITCVQHMFQVQGPSLTPPLSWVMVITHQPPLLRVEWLWLGLECVVFC